jgi:hypothetical protein
METLQKTRPRPIEEIPDNPNRKKKNRFPGWLILLVGFSLFMALKFTDVVTFKGDEAALSEKRNHELEEQLKKLDGAEQYVLLSTVDGWYERYHYPSMKIFLHQGDVWKYGVTIKGKKGRYSFHYYADRNLKYVMEFSGTLQACIAMEKIKIFNCPLLSENLKRPEAERLTHPPGNKRAR